MFKNDSVVNQSKSELLGALHAPLFSVSVLNNLIDQKEGVMPMLHKKVLNLLNKSALWIYGSAKYVIKQLLIVAAGILVGFLMLVFMHYATGSV